MLSYECYHQDFIRSLLNNGMVFALRTSYDILNLNTIEYYQKLVLMVIPRIPKVGGK